MFQSTRPRGARRSDLLAPVVAFCVSIHAPAWGATKIKGGATRPRRVSIHAPAWGATNFCEDIQVIFSVSIHAPAWGATNPPTGELYSSQSFNPRARVGRDLKFSSFILHPHKFQSTRPRGARQD